MPRLVGYRGSSGGFGELLPFLAGKLDQLAADRLEFGGAVVIFDFLRVVGDGVDQTVARKIALGDQVTKNACSLVVIEQVTISQDLNALHGVTGEPDSH